MPHTIFHPEAEAEMASAIGYYKTEAGSGTSVKFIARVEDAVATVKVDPDACPLIQGPYRRQRVFKFPYDVIFRVNTDSLLIVAIAHHAREPHYWQDRT